MSHGRASPNAWDYSFEGQIPSSGLCVYTHAHARIIFNNQKKRLTVKPGVRITSVVSVLGSLRRDYTV